MKIERIITPHNIEWGRIYVSRPRELRFMKAPQDNEEAQWTWVSIDELLRTLKEVHFARKGTRALEKEEPNLTFGELVENFRPLFVLRHLCLDEYEPHMRLRPPFRHITLDPKDERMFGCNSISEYRAMDVPLGQVLIPKGCSVNLQAMVTDLRMHHIDAVPPPGYAQAAVADAPPMLWAHSYSETEHVQLELKKTPNPHWTWGKVITTPLGA